MTDCGADSVPVWQSYGRWVARRYSYRTDAEDIESVALVGAWRAVQKAPATCSPARAAVLGAEWAVKSYLRVQEGGRRRRRVETVSIETIRDEEGCGFDPPVEDFAPLELERLWLWETARRVLTDRQYDLIRRLYVRRDLQREIAAGYGVALNTIWKWRKDALAALRAGLEE